MLTILSSEMSGKTHQNVRQTCECCMLDAWIPAAAPEQGRYSRKPSSAAVCVCVCVGGFGVEEVMMGPSGQFREQWSPLFGNHPSPFFTDNPFTQCRLSCSFLSDHHITLVSL